MQKDSWWNKRADIVKEAINLIEKKYQNKAEKIRKQGIKSKRYVDVFSDDLSSIMFSNRKEIKS